MTPKVTGREPTTPLSSTNKVPGSHITDLQKPGAASARAGLEDVRIHDLRHSYASRALALGESLTMIGKLLGHRQVQTTARYAHLARDSIQNAAARITGSIGGNLVPSNQRAAHDVSERPVSPSPATSPGSLTTASGFRSLPVSSTRAALSASRYPWADHSRGRYDPSGPIRRHRAGGGTANSPDPSSHR